MGVDLQRLLEDVGKSGLGLPKEQRTDNEHDDARCKNNRHLKRTGLRQMEEGTAIPGHDQRHRIQSRNRSKVLWDPFHRVEDRREVEPEQQDDLECLDRISEKNVKSCDDPAQSLREEEQHEHIKKDP